MQDGVMNSDGPTTIGARLAAARTALGLSIEDIGMRTRIPIRHLATIERDGVDDLPALPYTLGFLRSYARLVGLDPEIAAQEYRARLNAVPSKGYVAPEPYEPADPARVPPRWLALIALAVAVAIALGYAIWRGDGLLGRGGENPSALAAHGPDAAPAADSTPGAAPAASIPPQPQPTGLVSLTATQPVWVRVYEMDGPTLFQGEMKPGQRFEVPAAAVDPRVRTGRAQSLVVRIGDTVVAPLGAADRTLADLSLKATALLARPATPAAGSGAIDGTSLPIAPPSPDAGT